MIGERLSLVSKEKNIIAISHSRLVTGASSLDTVTSMPFLLLVQVRAFGQLLTRHICLSSERLCLFQVLCRLLFPEPDGCAWARPCSPGRLADKSRKFPHVKVKVLTLSTEPDNTEPGGDSHSSSPEDTGSWVPSAGEEARSPPAPAP